MARCVVTWLPLLLLLKCTKGRTITILPNVSGRIAYGGIGAISGGGATSRLLVSYPEKQRNEILDLLFKPQFAASLQILKVEIGGDAQSTDGTEASHRHTKQEEPSFQRGYEWWLMKEAKVRNPDIRIWALPWAFPGWVDPSGEGNPYKEPNLTAQYVAEWVAGARDRHGLHVDMVGSWNERAWNSDYLKALRIALDKQSLHTTCIIAPDGGGGVPTLAREMLHDPSLFQVVDALGDHYPGMSTSTVAKQVAARGGKLLYASEDYGVYFGPSGGKAWARLLNHNYITGLMSGTIAWNLVTSYYSPYTTAYYGPVSDLPGPAPLTALPYRFCGLMHAAWPWSAHYVPTAQLYVTAHHTQFVKLGWDYLPVGHGSGPLANGGSMVSLVSPDGRGLTIVAEKMSWAGSQSAWQGLPEYNTSVEVVSLELPHHKGERFALWISELPAEPSASGESPEYLARVFNREPDLFVSVDGHLEFKVCVDCLVTLTTEVNAGHKGFFAPPPPAKGFPLPYADDFSTYEVGSEPHYFADQAGSFEIVASAGKRFALRQMVMQKPCTWGQDEAPLSIIGDSNWTDTTTSVDVLLENEGVVWVGARLLSGTDPRPPKPNPPVIDHRPHRITPDSKHTEQAKRDRTSASDGLFLTNSTGVFLSVVTKGQEWILSLYVFGVPLARGPLPKKVRPGAWHRLKLSVLGSIASGSLDGTPLFDHVNVSACQNSHGFAAIGTGGFYPAQFDDIEIIGMSAQSASSAVVNLV